MSYSSSSSESKYFTIDARTILQLGRDSIKEFTTALIELVKNCYDADAENVEIEIWTKKENGVYIRIADDGFGMTETVIDSNWLRIGFSEKRTIKRSQRNRRKTGEKGIGRIAADRLGKKLTLLTKSADDKPQGLVVHWELFDVDNTSIDKVPIDVVTVPSPNLPGNKKVGTEILIEEYRHTWELSDIEKLYTELTTLTSPFSANEKFNIRLKTDVDERFANVKIESTFIDAAEIELRVEYDGKQKSLEYYIENRRYPGKEYLERIPIDQLISKSEKQSSAKLKCGPFQIRLLFFLRDSSVLERSNYSKLADFRADLNSNLGIKIYRDNISVKPYGYADSKYGDWLGLANRKAQNPAGVGRDDYRVTPNQLVGAVFIERDTNQGLKDSAAREGLVENDEFEDLKEVVLAAVKVLESHRVAVNREESGKPKNKRKSVADSRLPNAEKLQQINEGLSNAGSILDQVAMNSNEKQKSELGKTKDILSIVGKDINETIVEMLNERRTLNGLATLGITTAVFGHETEGAIVNLKQAASNVFDYLSFEEPEIDNSLSELVKVRKFSKQIGSWGDFALSRIVKEKRSNPIDRGIHEIIGIVLEEIRPMIEGTDIKFEEDIVHKVYSRVYPLDIEAILFNLITNAYQASLQIASERNIYVRLWREDRKGIDGYCLQVEDNGPGIAPEFIDMIWKPLFSTKIGSKKKDESGTGLGLTIVQSIVIELNGSITAENSQSSNGAKFTVWLPRIRK